MTSHSARPELFGAEADLGLPAAAPDSGAAPRLRPAPTPALGEVYEAEFDYVVRCLRGLGVPAASLDDAVQDLFLVVQRRLPEFDGQGRLRTWLYAIALRVARKHRTRHARDAARFASDAGDGDAAADSGAEAAVLRGERLAIARQALGRLEASKREVFVLAQIEQLSGPEVARITGLPLGTVYSRLRAARLAFDSHVARLMGAPLESATRVTEKKP